MRWSGAILGTVTGTATVTVGLAAAFVPDLGPAEMLLGGMWWWTVGKLWMETGVMPRGFGVGTAALGVIGFVALVAGAVTGSPAVSAAPPEPAGWIVVRYVSAAWLAGLAFALFRTR